MSQFTLIDGLETLIFISSQILAEIKNQDVPEEILMAHRRFYWKWLNGEAFELVIEGSYVHATPVGITQCS